MFKCVNVKADPFFNLNSLTKKKTGYDTLTKDPNSTMGRGTLKKEDHSQSVDEPKKAKRGQNIYEMSGNLSSIKDSSVVDLETKVDLGAFQTSTDVEVMKVQQSQVNPNEPGVKIGEKEQ